MLSWHGVFRARLGAASCFKVVMLYKVGIVFCVSSRQWQTLGEAACGDPGVVGVSVAAGVAGGGGKAAPGPGDFVVVAEDGDGGDPVADAVDALGAPATGDLPLGQFTDGHEGDADRRPGEGGEDRRGEAAADEVRGDVGIDDDEAHPSGVVGSA